ncbi:hypothetical protein FRB99_005343 [Tulasnella sp. 403]|nr:hypothetical protein FRB99_005343 [Tulasnella sp. 403]
MTNPARDYIYQRAVQAATSPYDPRKPIGSAYPMAYSSHPAPAYAQSYDPLCTPPPPLSQHVRRTQGYPEPSSSPESQRTRMSLSPTLTRSDSSMSPPPYSQDTLVDISPSLPEEDEDYPTRYARRILPTIEVGTKFVLLTDYGPVIAKASQTVRYRLFLVKARIANANTRGSMRYAAIDHDSVYGSWYSAITSDDKSLLTLMCRSKEKFGWLFADLRPSGYQRERRWNEKAFLELATQREIDWEDTEWMVSLS